MTLGAKLGSGGEADVFESVDGSEAVKVYHAGGQYDPFHQVKMGARMEKVRAMIAARPTDPMQSMGWHSLAWPTSVEVDLNGLFAGFHMPKIDKAHTATLFQVFTPRERMQHRPGVTWAFLVRVAIHTVQVMEAVHAAGHVIGDVNESNFLVSDQALVSAVDCDSFQIRDPGTGRIHHCLVGKSERIAPEFQGKDFSQVELTPQSDAFSLAILLFQLLMEGGHPFQSSYQNNQPVPIETNIRAGRFPYLARSGLQPPKTAVPFSVLPPAVRALFERAFVAGANHPASRPTPAEWRLALTHLEKELKTCSAVRTHEYPRHCASCPWCERVRKGIPEPFPTSRQSAPTRPIQVPPQSAPPLQPQRPLPPRPQFGTPPTPPAPRVPAPISVTSPPTLPRPPAMPTPGTRPAARRSRPRPKQALAIGGAAAALVWVLGGHPLFGLGSGIGPTTNVTSTGQPDTSNGSTGSNGTSGSNGTTGTTGNSYPSLVLTGKECGRSGAGAFAATASANIHTSCEFALAVRKAYVRAKPKGGDVVLKQVWSPKTKKRYDMTCSSGQPVTCTGGNDAVVYIYGGQAEFSG